MLAEILKEMKPKHTIKRILFLSLTFWMQASDGYDVPFTSRNPQSLWIIGAITLVTCLLVLLAVILLRLNKRLKAEVNERKLAEKAIAKERDFVQAVLKWVESIVVVIDLDGLIVTFNRAAERCSGYTLEEVNQVPFWDILIKEEEKERVQSVILNVKQESLPRENRNYWIAKDGHEVLIQWFNSVLTGADGSIAYILCTGHDLTDRNNAEKALEKREEHYQTVLENMEEGYFEVNLDGTFRAVNKSLIRILGYSLPELRSMDNRHIMDSKTAGKVFQVFNSIYLTGQPRNLLAFEIIRKEGDRRMIEVSASLLQDSTGNPIGFFGLTRDVTERIRMEQMMVQTEKMMSVGGLAAGMAHEINNPLAVIVQGAQNIERRLLPGLKKNQESAKRLNIDLDQLQGYLKEREILEMLSNIMSAGKRAGDIITNMLRFSRKGSDQKIDISVSQLVERTLDLAQKDQNLQKRFNFDRITIHQQIDEQLPQIPCIEQEIEQVLLNIITNAAQAFHEMEPAAPAPLIEIKAFLEKEMLQLEITDNGPGIPETIKHRVFEPFFTTKPPGIGTGLGMSVSFMIITNNHNGTIEVDSKPGEGARFIIRLPIQATEKPGTNSS